MTLKIKTVYFSILKNGFRKIFYVELQRQVGTDLTQAVEMNELFSPAALASQTLYVDKGNSRRVFLHEIKNFRVKRLFFPKIMTISTDLAISNNMSSFVLKYWPNCQILLAIHWKKK